MNAAIIIMTILGCDDSATQCHYVETVDRQWATIQTCDADSEARLRGYSNLKYPVVVAVCQTPEDAGMVDAAIEDGSVLAEAPDKRTDPDSAHSTEAQASVASRVFTQIKGVLPAAAGIKSLIAKPVHFVTDGYSWVAQRFEK
ncbi:hypothetical protein DFR52_101350 [Hoeflea marina]|uniref:Uncharacterized protein n=1 Tax=Hoeflea marina TaxID=274592 RepID=A0A317PSS1_9HYPH|nr:hypothetical protein [Hoeflea marina]PWW03664.1 hypothetical protein DFR52_101350 [Hoeflea marina]